MATKPLRTLALALPVALAVALVSGCGKSPGPAQSAADSTPQAAQPATDGTTPPPEAAQAQAEADRAADLAAKEKELADREAQLKQKELETELARRDAENAAAAAAAARAAASKPAPARNAAPPAKTTAVAATAPSQPPPPPPPIQVPAGSGISVALASELSTKTAQVGDRVQGRLAADLVVDGRRAAAAGAPVQGSVTKVVSGSSKVGGTPTLVIKFDSLVAANGSSVSIDAPYKQQGTSETAKDTAKIVGGAAAGAIIGHQVSHKSGSVVGGVLGGAAGTAIAHGTGNEVTIPAGTVVNVTVRNAFQVGGG